MVSKELYTMHIVKDILTDSSTRSQNEDIKKMSSKSINEMIDKFNEDYGSPRSHFLGYKNKGLSWHYIGPSETGVVMIAVFNNKNDILSSDQIVSLS